MYARFFDLEKKAFTRDPCFMVIVLPSTGLDGPTITLTSDEGWGDDKLVHLLGLPATDTKEYLLIPVCGTVGSKCLSGLYPTQICSLILNTPLVWCING
jgi:hypothetical protein